MTLTTPTRKLSFPPKVRKEAFSLNHLAKLTQTPETSLRRRLNAAGIFGDTSIDGNRIAFSRSRAEKIREWVAADLMAKQWEWVARAYDGESVHEYSKIHDPAKFAEATRQSEKFAARAEKIRQSLTSTK